MFRPFPNLCTCWTWIRCLLMTNLNLARERFVSTTAAAKFCLWFMNLNPVFFCCCCLFALVSRQAPLIISSATVRPVACCFCWCLSAVVLSAAAVLFCSVFCSPFGKVFLWRFINIFSGLLCWCPLEGEGKEKKEAPNRPQNHRLLFAACLYKIFYCIYSFTLVGCSS